MIATLNGQSKLDLQKVLEVFAVAAARDQLGAVFKDHNKDAIEHGVQLFDAVDADHCRPPNSQKLLRIKFFLDPRHRFSDQEFCPQAVDLYVVALGENPVDLIDVQTANTFIIPHGQTFQVSFAPRNKVAEQISDLVFQHSFAARNYSPANAVERFFK